MVSRRKQKISNAAFSNIGFHFNGFRNKNIIGAGNELITRKYFSLLITRKYFAVKQCFRFEKKIDLLRLRIPDSVNIPIILTVNNISIESISLEIKKKLNDLIILSAFWILEKLLIAYDTMLIIWIIIDTLASWNFNVLSSKTKKYPMLLFPILGFILKASATKTSLMLGMSWYHENILRSINAFDLKKIAVSSPYTWFCRHTNNTDTDNE